MAAFVRVEYRCTARASSSILPKRKRSASAPATASNAMSVPIATAATSPTARPRGALVIDLFGLEEMEVRRRFPDVYGHVWRNVKPERDANNRATYRDNWWIFGEPRRDFRPALNGLSRYIATVETAKHRIFQFLNAAILPDNMLVCMALDDAFHLGVLSSRIHGCWAAALGGTLEDRPRYTKSACFDPFPFPDASPADRARIAALAEELDETRKTVLAAQPDLTLITLYNLHEAVTRGAPLDSVAQDQRRRGRIDILHALHVHLDAAVAATYGWSATMTDKAIVAATVALNRTRQQEEREGIVRWLRPDYQLARAGVAQLGAPGDRPVQMEADLAAAPGRKPAFPRDAIGQTAAVLDLLRHTPLLTAADIAGHYAQGRRAVPRIEATLSALSRLGHVAIDPRGYRLRRAA